MVITFGSEWYELAPVLRLACEILETRNLHYDRYKKKKKTRPYTRGSKMRALVTDTFTKTPNRIYGNYQGNRLLLFSSFRSARNAEIRSVDAS